MKRLTGHLYFWVLVGIIAGGLIGYFDPKTGASLKPLGDGFIALVKMLISPVIFCTVVLGIAGAGDMKKSTTPDLGSTSTRTTSSPLPVVTSHRPSYSRTDFAKPTAQRGKFRGSARKLTTFSGAA